MRNRLLVALVGVPILLVVLLYLPPMYTPILISLLSMVAIHEMNGALGVTPMRIRIYAILFSGLIPFWVHFGEEQLLALIALFAYIVLLFVEALISKYNVRIELVGAVFFSSIFIPYFLSSMVRIGLGPLGQSYILLPIVVPFISDAVAMFSGMFFGKRKLAPDISPKKTVEGSLGGLLGGVLATLVYGFAIGQIFPVEVNYLYLMIYGLFGSVVSQVGDLSFSYIKRQNKIKDYGTIFPGHGGVLDRFDSVIFCAPFLEILIVLIPAFVAV